MPKTRPRFAQHFLEASWVAKLVAAIAPRDSDLFLEIGSGRGALTQPLAATGARVLAVEVDRDLAAQLESRAPSHVTVVAGDVLSVDLPALLATHLVPPGGSRAVRVVGNLPYKLSSPILFRLLALQRTAPLFVDATLMLQREVADRVVASPGTRAYGPVAVLTQVRSDARRILALPPGAFRPPPRVRSAVVQLRFRPPSVSLPDPDLFERMVRTMFQQRRKTLLNALRGFAEAAGTRPEHALRAAGLDPGLRPASLQLTELAALAAVFTSAERQAVL